MGALPVPEGPLVSISSSLHGLIAARLNASCNKSRPATQQRGLKLLANWTFKALAARAKRGCVMILSHFEGERKIQAAGAQAGRGRQVLNAAGWRRGCEIAD